MFGEVDHDLRALLEGLLQSEVEVDGDGVPRLTHQGVGRHGQIMNFAGPSISG